MRKVYVLRDGRLVPKASAPPIAATTMMPDIQPFVSPIDRREISSRSHLRAHNRTHGVVQVGDEPEFKPMALGGARRNGMLASDD